MRVADPAFATIGALRVRYSVQGDGPALLLMNGIGAGLELLQRFRDALAPMATIAFDVPGAGDSETPPWPWSMCRYAAFVADLLDHIGHRHVHVLGISWGGLLAQEFARRYPRRVGRLVLAATGAGWPTFPPHPRVARMLLSTRRYSSPAYLEEVAATLYGGAIRQHPDLLHEHGMERLRHQPDPRGYAWQMLAAGLWTNVLRIGRIQQSTLVLAGDDDPIVNLANARMLARLIPGARLTVVEGGGHLFLVTAPATHAAVVRDFLRAGAHGQ